MDKPLGVTSARAVSAVQRAFRAAGCPRLKIGHGGTLDPLATGVLPLALGEATKLVGDILNGDKAYRFTVRFGAATATDDAEGDVTEVSAIRPGDEAIAAALPGFIGHISQRPPAYSALKVAGERAYDLARRGEAVELAARTVRIHDLRLARRPTADEAVLEVRCGKGVYVRSLARDLAQRLGTVGHVSQLRRVAAGPFQEAQAISLDKLAEMNDAAALAGLVLPLTTGLDGIPALAVTPEEARKLRMGQSIFRPATPDGRLLVTGQDVPVALAESSGGQIRPKRGFNLSPMPME